MPPRKPAAGRQGASRKRPDPGAKPLTIRLRPDLHSRLQLYSLATGRPMNEVVGSLLDSYLGSPERKAAIDRMAADRQRLRRSG
jgi:hypothetical protein